MGMYEASASADGPLAWPGLIGLELYTVRDFFAKDPLGTLEKVAAIGYQMVEIPPEALGPGLEPAALAADLRAARMGAPSGYFSQPKTIDDWKRCVDQAHDCGLNYMVIGENAKLDADEWKRLAEFLSRCALVSQNAAIQLCYHPHFNEFAPLDDTNGVDILLQGSPNLLQMEMDIFWTVYAGADPLHYWRRYPGRFPLLHIKDLRKGGGIGFQEFLEPGAPDPFVPVGQGRIDWPRIFAHVEQAGARHIFVEQDRCALPEFEAIKISYDYLRRLRLG
jgi:sugar phosphate isomerase/epimerase